MNRRWTECADISIGAGDYIILRTAISSPGLGKIPREGD